MKTTTSNWLRYMAHIKSTYHSHSHICIFFSSHSHSHSRAHISYETIRMCAGMDIGHWAIGYSKQKYSESNQNQQIVQHIKFTVRRFQLCHDWLCTVLTTQRKKHLCLATSCFGVIYFSDSLSNKLAHIVLLICVWINLQYICRQKK